MKQQTVSLSEQRKAENRTKIQMGGLVIKSGLADYLGINAGEDLQLDPLALEKANVLLGALVDALERVHEDPSITGTWAFLGEKEMRRNFILDKNKS